ncbi:MAG: hypothetical protein KA419_15645 [Acidobacteria bacterium]|nr:hypothetical protein [Acidobacteriota bacterium]
MRLPCSQCGGNLEVSPVDRFMQCAFCGSSLVISRGKSYQPMLVTPLADGRRAMQAAAEALETDPAALGIPEVRFVPYWVSANRLTLAAPSLGVLTGVPTVRAKPAGDIRFRQDDLGTQWDPESFEEPETLPEEQEKPEVLFYPCYRIPAPGDDPETDEVWVDGMDATVFNAEPHSPFTVSVRQDLYWCAAAFVIPVAFALMPLPPWTPAVAGVTVAIGYLARGGR